MKSILALDVGGTHIRSAWVSKGELRGDARVRADLTGLAASAGKAAEDAVLGALVDHIRGRLGEGRAEAVALGMPGFINGAGVIAASPNLPGLTDLPLQRLLAAELGVPVAVANDGLCAARGAWLLEDPRPRSLAIVALGTGVGGGLILAGRPVAGDGGTAMEIGHLVMVPDGHPCGCGKRGCLEQYASAPALKRIDAERGGGGRGGKALAAAAEKGDEGAAAIYSSAGAYLGRAVATLVLLVDVRTVRIGGGLSRSWNLFSAALEESLDAHLIPPLRGLIDVAPVSPAEIDRIGLSGAADLAKAADPS
ncbi:MAG: ROK family protein [Myxococcota bacterium]